MVARTTILSGCIPALVAMLMLASAVGAQTPVVANGKYVGDGGSNREIVAGFQPDVVLVRGYTETYLKLSTIPAGGGLLSIELSDGGLASGVLAGVTPDGFRVSGNANRSNFTHHWVAIQAQGTGLAVGRYDGDLMEDRIIDISDTSAFADFEPDFVLVASVDGVRKAYHRYATVVGNQSFQFGQSLSTINRITGFAPNGFVVGSDSAVNAPGDQYVYLALEEVPGLFEVGSYLGNDIDDRAIPTTFRPTFLMITGDEFGTLQPIQRNNTDAVDAAADFDSFATPNRIQRFLPFGFEIGTELDVNRTGDVYHYLAIGGSPAVSVPSLSGPAPTLLLAALFGVAVVAGLRGRCTAALR